MYVYIDCGSLILILISSKGRYYHKRTSNNVLYCTMYITCFELSVRLSKNVSTKGNLQCVFKCFNSDECPFLLKPFMKLTTNKKTIFKNCKIESNANNLIINCDFSGAKLDIVTIVIFSTATNFLHFVSRLIPIKDVPIPAEYQTTSFCNHYSSMNMKNLCMMLNVITFFSTSLRKMMNQALQHGSLAIFSVIINFF